MTKKKQDRRQTVIIRTSWLYCSLLKNNDKKKYTS